MTNKKHNQCKHFGHKSCANKDNEIIKKATQDTPKYYGEIPITSFPLSEEVDAICSSCDSFTPK